MKTLFNSLAFFISLTISAASFAINPPVAIQVPEVTVLHGDTRIDNFAWLRNKADPAVREYLEAENAYADAALAPSLPLQEKLYHEFISHTQEDDTTAPVRSGDYLYYSRRIKGNQYGVYIRKDVNNKMPEETLLDANELSKGKPFYEIETKKVSPDGNYLAYTVDESGFSEMALHLKDLRTGVTQVIETDNFLSWDGFSWGPDSRSLFWVTQSESKRPYRLYRYEIGQSGPAQLLYTEENDNLNLEINISQSGDYLFAKSVGSDESDVRFLDLADSSSTLTLIAPLVTNRSYEVFHNGEFFYFLVKTKGHDFQLLKAPVNNYGPESWTREYTPAAGSFISYEKNSFNVFKKFLVIIEKNDKKPVVHVIDLKTGNHRFIDFPESVYQITVSRDDNPNYDAHLFRLTYESLATPPSVFDINLETGETQLIKQTDIPNFDPTLYRMERLNALAKDGTSIPISLLFKIDQTSDPSTPKPMYLEGYGSYGWSYELLFSKENLSLLDRGVVLAIAHVRGGGELGEGWYQGGKLENKMNTFTDFIAVAEHLIQSKRTSPDQLVIHGHSAGGLLIGSVLNLRPDLFKAAILGMPFVDVLNTMLDDSLPLTTQEYTEWGNPNIAKDYFNIKNYCPYTNIAAKSYPNLLVKTSWNDSQVLYHEPAKYVAKMRSLRTDQGLTLLKTGFEGNHTGSSGLYGYYRVKAQDFSFVLNQLGITE